MNKRYLFGIFLILLGIGFLLEQLNIINFGEIISIYWPSILILIGIIGLFDKNTSKIGNLFLIVLGTIFQINRLDIIDINIFQIIWPIILILIGVSIVFPSQNKNPEDRDSSGSQGKNISMEETLDEFVIMGSIEKDNQSDNFKGGKVIAIMGGVDLDLRGAKLHDNQAFLEIKSLMGGIDLLIPEDWRVEISGTPILGGFSSKRRTVNDPNAPVLKIDYLAIMGGVDIK